MNLDVLIPSLLLPALPPSQIPPPVAPAIERLLARADRMNGALPACANGIFEAWGVNAPYPSAAILAEHDGFDISNEGWMFAEPVHLIADRDRLTMFPSPFLELDKSESAAFIFALNSHFADRNLKFLAATPGRWYVRCPPGEIPSTTSPNAARTGSLTNFQPKSMGVLDWRSLQNEAQMLFFDHPLNLAREASGKPAVSGVWFWGGGIQPDLQKPSYDLIVTNSPLASQLASKTGLDVKALPWLPTEQGPENVLAVIESCEQFQLSHASESWAREVERLDREWLLPVSQALASGNIGRLRIHAPSGELARSFETSRRNHLFRFWRSNKPISSYA